MKTINRVQWLTALLAALLLSGCGKAEKSAPVPESIPVPETKITFADPRDGQTYRAVKIGEQTWMAENLNYQTDKSQCYKNCLDSCAKYGRLYTWYDALKACPKGWHLPSNNEWAALKHFVGGSDFLTDDFYTVGTKLKSKTGWYRGGPATDEYGFAVEGYKPATDDYGFSALPGGFGHPNSHGVWLGGSAQAGYDGYWWSATEDDRPCSYLGYNCEDIFSAQSRQMRYNFEGLIHYNGAPTAHLFSVRCLRDD